MASPVKRRATYDDLLAVPEHRIAEIVDGDLHVSPRPNPQHALAAYRLANRLGPPFDQGDGGPGGWWILFEPELHLGENVLVPDLAGWRRERLPALPSTPAFALAPDWVCEIMSPSTARLDRVRKMPAYAHAGVSYLWFVNPLEQTLEVYRLTDDGWLQLAMHEGRTVVRAAPFDAIEIDLALLWGDAAPVP
jgi:Uma2 family endonuclease